MLSQCRLGDLSRTVPEDKGFRGQAPRIITRNQNMFTTQSRPVSKLAKPSAGSSTQDSKLRDVILAEVLDTRPSVKWKDVAGLDNAKQVVYPCCLVCLSPVDCFKTRSNLSCRAIYPKRQPTFALHQKLCIVGSPGDGHFARCQS